MNAPQPVTRLLGTILFIFAPASSAFALEIVPTFSNTAGETWDATRQGVIEAAIDDWEAAIFDDETVDVTFDFTNAGTGGYLGQWSGSFIAPAGADLYPWSSGMDHTIHFNADLFDTGASNYTWWDPTPNDGGDQPFEAWDALTVARHEIAHMMGFTADFYVDNFSLGGEVDKWSTHISGTTFDSGGLDVEMAALDNLGHVADSGSTAGDLMVPTTPNNTRREISQTDLDMLSLAYDYQVVPEPSAAVIAVLGLLVVGVFRSRGSRKVASDGEIR